MIALSNGDYVLLVRTGTEDMGAVTWEPGTGPVSAVVSASNSLVGSITTDNVGGGAGGGAFALSNGNYVVASPYWDFGTGAATWVNGTDGSTRDGQNTIDPANSLVGDELRLNDYVGYAGVTALPNGNYIVLSPDWNRCGGGDMGKRRDRTIGEVSAANSLVQNLTAAGPPTVLPNGDYVSVNTWVDGATGRTLDGQNTPDAQNSVEFGRIVPLSDGSFIAGSTVAFTDPNLLSYAFGQGQTITITPTS